MNVTLSVKERLVLASILPSEGDFITYKTVRKLKEDLSFSDEEQESLKFKLLDGRTVWNNLNEKPKAVEFSDFAVDLIRKILDKINKDNKINDDNFSLYEKFMSII